MYTHHLKATQTWKIFWIIDLFAELQDSNLELKVIIPKPITGTYFDTNLSRFSLEVFPIAELYGEIWDLILLPPNLLLELIL